MSEYDEQKKYKRTNEVCKYEHTNKRTKDG